MTCAGVGKKQGAEFLKTFDNPFEAFHDNTIFPAEYTGKLTHTYIDEPMEGIAIDYKGQEFRYNQLSGIHLEPTSYNLDMSDLYLQYLAGRFQLI